MLKYRFDVIFIPQKVYLDWFWESIYTLYTPLPLATPLEPTPHTLSVCMGDACRLAVYDSATNVVRKVIVLSLTKMCFPLARLTIC